MRPPTPRNIGGVEPRPSSCHVLEGLTPRVITQCEQRRVDADDPYIRDRSELHRPRVVVRRRGRVRRPGFRRRLHEHEWIRSDRRQHLDEFVACYRPGDLHNRKQTWSEKKNPEGRWRSFTFEEIVARDKSSLDLFWLRDDSLEDSASLPDPNVLAQEIADDLRSALAQMEDILGDLEGRAARVSS
jgi:hypothetical protein